MDLQEPCIKKAKNQWKVAANKGAVEDMEVKMRSTVENLGRGVDQFPKLQATVSAINLLVNVCTVF